MEYNLNYFQMEENLNILGNARQQHFFLQMEDDLNMEWKMTSKHNLKQTKISLKPKTIKTRLIY
jgi:hypothetical protein